MVTLSFTPARNLVLWWNLLNISEIIQTDKFNYEQLMI